MVLESLYGLFLTATASVEVAEVAVSYLLWHFQNKDSQAKRQLASEQDFLATAGSWSQVLYM
jgi:hypothetical protein